MVYQTMHNVNGTLYGQSEVPWTSNNSMTIPWNDPYGNEKGLEYSRHIPDNVVVGSPGGTSQFFHSATPGIYEKQFEFTDGYANFDTSKNAVYESGNYGNIYNKGMHTAYYNAYARQPKKDHYFDSPQPQNTLVERGYVPNMKTVEGFSNTDIPPTEYINYDEDDEPVKSTKLKIPSKSSKTKKKNTIEGYTLSSDIPKRTKRINPILLFVCIVLLYIVFMFWGNSVTSFFVNVLHESENIPWSKMMLYSIFFSIIFLLMMFIVGVPLIDLIEV
jgi:hypothetical protein